MPDGNLLRSVSSWGGTALVQYGNLLLGGKLPSASEKYHLLCHLHPWYGLKSQKKVPVMFALKRPLQNTRRHPVLKQAMKWDQLPDSSFFYSYPLCSRESRSKTTTVMTQKEKVQKLPNEEERLGYLRYLTYAMHQACPNMKKKKSLYPRPKY